MIKIIFVFILLFIQIKGISLAEKINIKIDEAVKNISEYNNVNVKKEYKIDISSGIQMKEYLKIEVNSLKLDGAKYIYFFSKEEMENREQIAEPINKVTIMYLKKEQISNKIFYLIIESKFDKICDYTISFSFTDYVQLQSINNIFSYYVSSKNKKMSFSLENLQNESSNKIITIFATGNKEIKIFGLANYKFTKFNNGLITTFINNDENKNIIFDIEGEEGDIINVGYKLKNIINENNPGIFGYLKKELNKEECYDININKENINNEKSFIIEGILMNRKVKIKFKNNNNQDIEKTIKIKDESFIETFYPFDNTGNLLYKYFCISLHDDDNDDDLIYSIKLYEKKDIKSNSLENNIFGTFYSKIIPVNSNIYFKMDNNLMNYIMISDSGYPVMYYYRCETYPKCNPKMDNLEQLSNKTLKINNIYSYKLKSELGNDKINKKQDIVFIHCPEYSYFTNSECQFKYIIYDNKDIINMKEYNEFSKYLFKDEINNFKINNLEDKEISKIIIDINIFNGDIITNIIENEIKYSIKNLPNKISYIINVQENNNLKNINIQIKALINSYFDIGYRTIKSNNENHVYLKSNFQYLLTLDDNFNNNIIYFENKDQKRGNTFVVNFYNLNCKININKLYTRNKEQINLIDNFVQETFTIYNGNYYSEYYNYEVKILSLDNSYYTDKICLLYVSGYEAPKYNNHFLRKEILINENIPHRIKFAEGIKNITYLYNHINLNNDEKNNIIVQFKQINAAKYIVRFYFDDNILLKNLSDYTFENPYNFDLSISKQFYFNKTNWNNFCKRNICNVKIEIELILSSNEEEPILETLIRREQSIPIFIEKNKFISDFFSKNNWVYYYTDIGKGDYGNIKVNYYKSSGEIFAKIIKKKDMKSWTEEKFPKIEFLKKEGSLNYIKINAEDTKDCEDDGGCYLLISMCSNIKGPVSDMLQIFYYNLGIIIQNDNNKNPQVGLSLNELIMGNIPSSLNNDNYNIIFPSNVYEIFIDFQTYENNDSIILINIGKSQPNKENYHFIFKSKEENSIFKLNINEIINKANEYNIDLPNNYKGYNNIELSISIYFNKINYMKTGIYTIKFHISMNTELDYYITKSNQKALCQPKITSENKYQCLYSIYLFANDQLSPMLLYVNLKNKNDKAKIYANYFARNLIETWDKQLTNDIPTFFNGMHNEFNKNNYLNVSTLGNDGHLLVNINVNKNEKIEFFSSFYNITYITPSPSMTQLYVVNHNDLEIEFPLNSNLIIELIPVNGKGYLYWKENPDKIFEINNKLILYRGNELKSSNIIIKNTNPTFNDLIFYLKYIVKAINENIVSQEMNVETSFIYDKIKLPIYIFSKLTSLDKDINIILKFENLDINFSEFKISGSISKLNNLNNPQIIIDNEIDCEYDPILRTSSIYIPNNKIKLYNLNDNPILLINLSNNKEYSNIKFDSYISQKEMEISPHNKKYYYGKLSNNSIYKIKIDFINRRYIKIFFSSNNENVEWSINRKEGSKVNDTFKEMKSELKNGITTLTFKSTKSYFLYLNIFIRNDINLINNNNYLSYVFKVSDSPKSDFIKYSISNDDNLKLEKISMNSFYYNYRIILNEISGIKENTDITYFVKLLNKTSNKEEIKDGIYLSKLDNYFEMKNKGIENGKINLDIYNISDKEYNYIKVIALIEDKNRNNYEYISYKGRNLDIDINKGDKINPSGGNNHHSNNSIMIIIIIVVSVIIIVVGGIIGYFTYKYIKSGQNLLNKVNSISFQDEKNTNLLISPLNSNEDDFILD